MPIQIADKLIPAFTGSLIDQIDFFSNISGSEISASGKLIGNELQIGGQTFTSNTIGGVQSVSELQDLTGFDNNISGSWQGELSSSTYLQQVGSTISGSVNAFLSGSLSQLTNISASGFVTTSGVFSSGEISASGFKANFFEITSSVLITSESTQFGNSEDDLHDFSGSVNVLGNITASGNISGSKDSILTVGNSIEIGGSGGSQLTPTQLFLDSTSDSVLLKPGQTGLDDGQAQLLSHGSLSVILDTLNAGTQNYFNIKKNSLLPQNATEIFRIDESGNVSASGNVLANHMTASGDISASGTVMGTNIMTITASLGELYQDSQQATASIEAITASLGELYQDSQQATASIEAITASITTLNSLQQAATSSIETITASLGELYEDSQQATASITDITASIGTIVSGNFDGTNITSSVISSSTITTTELTASTISASDSVTLGAGLTVAGNTILNNSQATSQVIIAGNGNVNLLAANIAGNDKIGIGNVNPASKLDITGDLKVSTNITSSNISASGIVMGDNIMTITASLGELYQDSQQATQSIEYITSSIDYITASLGDLFTNSASLSASISSTSSSLGLATSSIEAITSSINTFVSGNFSGTNITSSDISSSGLLYISASEQIDQSTYGVLVRDPSTGKIYHTGSFGSGIANYNDLTNIPSGIISSSEQVFTNITSSNISASGNITASNIFATGQVSASVLKTNFTEITSSIIITSASTEFGNSADDTHVFSGSITASGNISSSGRMNATNINVGTPTSNAWQTNLEGSFFNNFSPDSDVSEILRFMAGVLSHSLDVADAQPNTKIYNSIDTSHNDGNETSKSNLFNGVLGSTYENARLSEDWPNSDKIDLDLTASYKEVLDYLEHKGWVLNSDRGSSDDDVGTNPFHGTYATRIPTIITTQATFGTFSHTLTSNAGGTTIVNSSNDSELFGLGGLTDANATEFRVRVIATQSFSDNFSDSTPDENSTFTRKALNDLSISTFGTSNGLTLAKIETAQPAVIPGAFQDGKFESVDGAINGRQYTGGATSATNISASGYYKYHDVKVGIASGSQTDSQFEYKTGDDSNTRFYIYTGGLPTNITTGAPTVVLTKVLTRTGFTATSRSLSGVPYLLTTTYDYTFNTEVSKSFDPAFGYATSILVNSNPTDQWENIGSTTISNTTTTVNNSGVSSTGDNNYVINNAYSSKRSSGNNPDITDIAVASSSFTFTLDSNSTNVSQNRTSNNTKNYNLSFKVTGRNWKNSSQNSTTTNESFYDDALFGQSASSGSVAIYSREQGYDNSTSTLSEDFSGEDYRIKLNNNVTTFTGNSFTTNVFRTNDNGDEILGRNDLQVKPGYLVDPTGSYGYWFTSDSLQASSAGYRYYIRKFTKTSGTKNSMTINVGKTLVNWNSTSTGVAVGLILESGTSAGSNTSISTCRIFDPSATTSNLIESGISTDNFKNPFSSNIDLYGNTGGSKSSTTYTIPMRNSDGMFLTGNDDSLYVIIRYKGDPDPVENITITYS